LVAAGWRLRDVPADVTLAALRDAGAPFKGSKYFDQQARATDEVPVQAGEIAYRAGLMPGSLNQTYAACERLVAGLVSLLPAGTRPEIGAAALYVWLFVEHHGEHGAWPIAGCYTWAADRSSTGRLAVGIFGRERPLVVSPIPEATGRGIGVMPVIVPA
jgi:hypothetical protein